MAVKQNGVLAHFTPTVSKYTNQTLPANGNTVAPNGYNIYTCPNATLMSGKVFVANNTGGALDIDIGIVEQSDVIQLDTPGNQPGSPSNYTNFLISNNTSNGYTTSIVIEYGNLGGTSTFAQGETLSWTNSGYGGAQTAIIHYWDQANGKLWLRNMSHPKGLDLPGDTNFTSSGGGTFSVGTSYAGTSGTAGWSGYVRYFDALTGKIYFLNHEFRNNIDYAQIYDINKEVREQANNNLNRMNKFWRPVTVNQDKFAGVGNSTPVTEFIDNNGAELLVGSVSQATTEQLIVNGKQIADNTVEEFSGIVLGQYQSLFVKSTGALTFTLVGFEEVAEVPS